MRQVVVYKSLKTMENINHKAQKLVVVDGPLLEVPTVRLRLGKLWCFGLAIAYGRWSYERWSHMEVQQY